MPMSVVPPLLTLPLAWLCRLLFTACQHNTNCRSDIISWVLKIICTSSYFFKVFSDPSALHKGLTSSFNVNWAQAWVKQVSASILRLTFVWMNVCVWADSRHSRPLCMTVYGYRSRCPSRNLLSFSQAFSSLPVPFFSSRASEPWCFPLPPPRSPFRSSALFNTVKRDVYNKSSDWFVRLRSDV